MPIRTGRLWKKCIKCEKKFEPEGSNPKLCSKCFETRYEERNAMKKAKAEEARKVLNYKKTKNGN